MDGMLDVGYGTSYTPQMYRKVLNTWSQLDLQTGVALGANGMQYPCDTSGRQVLIDTFGWNVYGDEALDCTITINGDDDGATVQSVFPSGSVVGQLAVEGEFSLQQLNPFSLTCTVPGDDDSFFVVDGDELKAAAALDAETPLDANENNSYRVCIRATSDDGSVHDNQLSIIVNPEPYVGTVTGVSSAIEDGKQILTVTGTFDPDTGIGSDSVLQKPFVVLNGVAVPFCSEPSSDENMFQTAAGVTEYYDTYYGVDVTGMVSDVAPCYYLFDNTNFRSLYSEVQIWVPNEFDATAPNIISVNDSTTFAFSVADVDPIDDPDNTTAGGTGAVVPGAPNTGIEGIRAVVTSQGVVPFMVIGAVIAVVTGSVIFLSRRQFHSK